MLRKIINPILFLPLALSINSLNVLAIETKGYIDKVLEEIAEQTMNRYFCNKHRNHHIQDWYKMICKKQSHQVLQNL